MLNELLEIGFLAGSRAFGTARDDSDYDIVYSIDDAIKIDAIIQGCVRKPSDYFAGYYIQSGNRQINLIPVHPHEYLPWYLATKAMTATLIESGIKDTIKKYSVFMGIVSLFKGMVDRQGNLTEYERLRKSIRRNDAS